MAPDYKLKPDLLTISGKHERISALVLLVPMLIDLYTEEKTKRALGKNEGKEIEVVIPALEGSFTVTMYSGKILARHGKSENAVARLVIKGAEDEIVERIVYILKKPNTFKSILIMLGQILRGNYSFRGSIPAVIRFLKCLMIGNTEPFLKKEGNDER